MPTIAVLGAFDTKGTEFTYLIELIKARSHHVLTIDTGILNEPEFKPGISAERVADVGGASLAQIRMQADRGPAIRINPSSQSCYNYR